MTQPKHNERDVVLESAELEQAKGGAELRLAAGRLFDLNVFETRLAVEPIDSEFAGSLNWDDFRIEGLQGLNVEDVGRS